jgi:hypothetical protein
MGQVKAVLAGIDISRELGELKAKGLAAIRALISRPDATTDDDRTASLIRAFAFAAKLTATLHDELLDTDGQTKIVRLMNEIARSLDSIGPGRIVLAVLLEHPDDRVCASAGAYLLVVNLMPERVLPILREIENKGNGDSADFTAHNAMLYWECEWKRKGLDG